MVKIVVIGALIFFGLIIAGIRRRREENLEIITRQMAFKQDASGEEQEILGNVLHRSFLFVKGAYYEILNSYSRTDPNQHLLDLKYRSTGNVDITFQRLVFIFPSTSGKVKNFVLENPDNINRSTTDKGLKEAGFMTYNYGNKPSYIKSADQQWFDETFNSIADSLVKIYSDICIEHHLGHFLVYRNRSNLSTKEVPQFYETIIKHLWSFVHP